MLYWKWFMLWLGKPSTLFLLFVVNFFGTVWGYLWYKHQLLETPWYYWPLVADSPTASLFFCLVLFAWLIGKRCAFCEAFAMVTLFKYGLWATIMIIWTGSLGGELLWEHYLLIFSHLGMAIQALLYSKYYSFRWHHLGLVALWTIMNDFLDYWLGIFPRLSRLLHPYIPSQDAMAQLRWLDILPRIFGLTLLLGLIGLMLAYVLVIRKSTLN